MVLGVCRRVLGNHHDAEDAFQATFLVLARKGASVRARELLGNWLHGVAYRTALRARAMIARRHKHEQRARELARPKPPADADWQEVLPVLDRELDGLPEHYRVALVLCDLQGVTRRQAARQLGLPEGTLSGRLTRARQLLARRLARYGLAPSAGALAMILGETTASAHLPSSLAASTARAAVLVVRGLLTAGTVPAQVVALTEGVIKAMLLTKLKSFMALALVLVVGAGVVGLTQGKGSGPTEPGQARAVQGARHLADDLDALRLEVEALRKALQATRERVKSLETEVESLQRSGGAAPASRGQISEPVNRSGGIRPGANNREGRQPPGAIQESGRPVSGVIRPGANDREGRQPPGAVQESGRPVPRETTEILSPGSRGVSEARIFDDPVVLQAEAALKALREAGDAEARQRAADALEKALKRLKEREQPNRTMPNKPGNVRP
jgi:RNA polymerase sigma factor (sigma-70 family)